MDHGGPVDPELQGKLNAHLAGLLGMDLAVFTAPCDRDGLDAPMADGGDTAAAGGEEDEKDAPMADDDDVPAAAAAANEEVAFQFRLFRGETPSHTVVIKPHEDDDAAAAGPGALVHARRPQSYYVAGEPDAQAAERFRLAAVSADYLLADAAGRRWGLATPWRVTHITVTPTTTDKEAATAATAATALRKKRPGKKRRIILRGRIKARKEKEEAAKRQAAEKEEHLLDKKKRLNRQKKLRRRAKKREGKTADDGSSRATTPE